MPRLLGELGLGRPGRRSQPQSAGGDAQAGNFQRLAPDPFGSLRIRPSTHSSYSFSLTRRHDFSMPGDGLWAAGRPGEPTASVVKEHRWQARPRFGMPFVFNSQAS